MPAARVTLSGTIRPIRTGSFGHRPSIGQAVTLGLVALRCIAAPAHPIGGTGRAAIACCSIDPTAGERRPVGECGLDLSAVQ